MKNNKAARSVAMLNKIKEVMKIRTFDLVGEHPILSHLMGAVVPESMDLNTVYTVFNRQTLTGMLVMACHYKEWDVHLAGVLTHELVHYDQVIRGDLKPSVGATTRWLDGMGWKKVKVGGLQIYKDKLYDVPEDADPRKLEYYQEFPWEKEAIEAQAKYIGSHLPNIKNNAEALMRFCMGEALSTETEEITQDTQKEVMNYLNALVDEHFIVD